MYFPCSFFSLCYFSSSEKTGLNRDSKSRVDDWPDKHDGYLTVYLMKSMDFVY